MTPSSASKTKIETINIKLKTRNTHIKDTKINSLMFPESFEKILWLKSEFLINKRWSAIEQGLSLVGTTTSHVEMAHDIFMLPPYYAGIIGEQKNCK